MDAAERDVRAGLAAGESGLVMSYSNLAWPNVRALHGLAGYREAQAVMGIPAWRARQR